MADWGRVGMMDRGSPKALFWGFRESQSREEAGTKQGVEEGISGSTVQHRQASPVLQGALLLQDGPCVPVGVKNCHQAIGCMVGIWYTLPAWMQVGWSSLKPLESSFVRTEDGVE